MRLELRRVGSKFNVRDKDLRNVVNGEDEEKWDRQIKKEKRGESIIDQEASPGHGLSGLPDFEHYRAEISNIIGPRFRTFDARPK